MAGNRGAVLYRKWTYISIYIKYWLNEQFVFMILMRLFQQYCPISFFWDVRKCHSVNWDENGNFTNGTPFASFDKFVYQKLELKLLLETKWEKFKSEILKTKWPLSQMLLRHKLNEAIEFLIRLLLFPLFIL